MTDARLRASAAVHQGAARPPSAWLAHSPTGPLTGPLTLRTSTVCHGRLRTSRLLSRRSTDIRGRTEHHDTVEVPGSSPVVPTKCLVEGRFCHRVAARKSASPPPPLHTGRRGCGSALRSVPATLATARACARHGVELPPMRPTFDTHLGTRDRTRCAAPDAPAPASSCQGSARRGVPPCEIAEHHGRPEGPSWSAVGHPER